MELSPSLVLALWSLPVGAFLCAVYDLFRAFRLCCPVNKFFLFISDLAFSLIAAATMLVLFFNLSNGRVRAFSLALTACGFLVWRFTISRLTMFVFKKVISFLSRLLNSIKIGVFAFLSKVRRRIYTKIYCRILIKNSKHGFGMFKNQKGILK